MNKLNKLYLGMSLAICSIVISQNSFAANNVSNTGVKYKLRVSHTDRANSIKGKFFIRFKELLEEKHPNIVVELNEYGKLAKKKQEIELLELGVVDMIAPDIDDLYEKTRDEKLRLVTLPYLFEKNEDYYKFIKSPVRVNFVKAVTNPANAYVPLSIIGEGYDLFASKNPIKEVSDFGDRDLVTSTTQTSQTFYNQLKIKTTSYSDFEDVNYLNTVTKANLFEVNKQKVMNNEVYEYFPNMFITNHKYSTSIILINKNWLNRLPENIKNSINDLLNENAKYNEDLLIKNEEIFNEKIMKPYSRSIVLLSVEDKAILKSLSRPMHEFYLDRVNRNLILDTYKVIQK